MPRFSSLRILHTVDDINISSGGSRKVAVELCAAQRACGARVDLVSQMRRHRAPGIDSTHVGHVQPHLVPLTLDSPRWRVAYSLFFRRKVLEVCRTEGIQIIHDHGLWLPCNHAAVQVAQRLRIPLVIHPGND